MGWIGFGETFHHRMDQCAVLGGIGVFIQISQGAQAQHFAGVNRIGVAHQGFDFSDRELSRTGIKRRTRHGTFGGTHGRRNIHCLGPVDPLRLGERVAAGP